MSEIRNTEGSWEVLQWFTNNWNSVTSKLDSLHFQLYCWRHNKGHTSFQIQLPTYIDNSFSFITWAHQCLCSANKSSIHQFGFVWILLFHVSFPIYIFIHLNNYQSLMQCFFRDVEVFVLNHNVRAILYIHISAERLLKKSPKWSVMSKEQVLAYVTGTCTRSCISSIRCSCKSQLCCSGQMKN